MKQCPKCSKEIFDSAMSCTYCGAKVEELTVGDPTAEDPTAAAVTVEETEESVAAAVEETVAETPAAPEPKAEPVPIPAPVAAELDTKPGGKGKKIGLAVGLVGLLAVAGIGVAALKSKVVEDPKDTVINAFKSVYQEDKIDYMDEIFGYKELYNNAALTNTEAGVGLTLENSSSYGLSDFSGMGFDMMFRSDIENEQYQAKIGLRYSDMDLVQSDIYVDQTEIMVAVPELSKKVFTLNYADDLAGQIERSPVLGESLGQYMGSGGFDWGAAKAYNEYVTSIQKQEAGSPFNVNEMWERYKVGSQAIDDLKAAMTVEKGDKAVKVVDGKEQTCRAYAVVIPGQAFIQFAGTTSEFFLADETIKLDMLELLEHTLAYSKTFDIYSYGSEDTQSPKAMRDELWDETEDKLQYILEELEEVLQDDVVMTVYVDEKGRMAALELATVLTVDSDTIADLTFDAQLKGGTYLLQNVTMELALLGDEGQKATLTLDKSESYVDDVLTTKVALAGGVTLTAEDDSEDYEINYSGSYDKANGEYEMELTVAGGYEEYLFTLEGIVENLEKGKSIHVIADKFTARTKNSYDSGEFLELSGDYYIKPLADEIEQPQGEEMDVLAATMMDWYGVMGEMQTNAAKFMDIFE